MSRHVVFGTGQVGRQIVSQLVTRDIEVVAVNGSGSCDVPGATALAGNATDPVFTTRACAGADVVYFCLNAAHYDRWEQEFPPLQRGVLAGAQAAGARLVVLDNLYGYGRTGGRPLVETLAAQPNSAKAATRVAMTDELLSAHDAGRAEVMIGRASDFFGPAVTASALGETVFAPAVKGRTAQVLGDPDQPHSYSYTPDVAGALITLAEAPAAAGNVWHLPVTAPATTREIVRRAYELAGHRPRLLAAGGTTLRLLGLVKPAMREYLHTIYQFTEPWVVDDSRFRAAFGRPDTPLDTALAETLRWYAGASRPAPAAAR